MKIKKKIIFTFFLIIVIFNLNSSRLIKSEASYKNLLLDLKPALNMDSSLFWYSQTGYEVQTVAISTDGNYIISGSKNYTSNRIGLYHKSNSQPLWVNNEVKGEVLEVDISSDGSYMVAGTGYAAGQGTLVYLFGKNSSAPLWSYQVDNIVFSVAISSDGNYIAAGSKNDRVYLFHRLSSTPIWSYKAGDHIASVDISSDGDYIVAGSGDHNVYLFHRSSSTPIWNHTVDHIPGNAGDVESVSISSDGSYIVAGTQIYEGTSHVYLFHQSNSTPIWKYAAGNFINSVSICANGEYMVAGGDDNKVFLFHRLGSSPIWSFTASSSISSVSISADGNYIIAGGYLWDQTVYFFNRMNNNPLWEYRTLDIVNSVGLSANGDYSVAGGVDGNVYLFTLDEVAPYTSINLITPENRTYFQPMSGYYPGTHGFEETMNGILPKDWYFVPHHGYGEAYVVEEVDGHHKVLKVEDTYEAAYPEAFQEFNPKEIGSVELYLRKETGASGLYFQLYDPNNTRAFSIKMDQHNNEKFEYGLGNNFIEFASGQYSDQTWFHFRVDFNTISDKVSIYLDGVLVLEKADFASPINVVAKIKIGGNYDYTGIFYADAIGYSWQDGYILGDNLHEGLLLSITNSTNLGWIGYSLDRCANITVKGNKVIPMPENGVHSIIVSGFTSNGTYLKSNLRYFTINQMDPPLLPLIPENPIILILTLNTIGIGLVVLIGLTIIIIRKKSLRRVKPSSVPKISPQMKEKRVIVTDIAKFCPFCGFRIQSTHRFCTNCGASLRNV